jgi:hypothetical protein
MNRRCALVSLSLFVGAVRTAEGQGNVLPQTLREDAQRRGCSEIRDFYDRPGRIDPAYVFGYFDSRLDEFGERSAIYWCRRSAGPQPYLLVIWVSDSTLAAGFRCPRTISWHNPPGGLRVLRDRRLVLSDFRYHEDPRAHGHAESFTDGPLIHSEYDGVIDRFYCHAGRWLVQQLH